jgi:two-component system, sensor histidine kinase and response regulator
VVEDTRINQVVATRMLARFGYRAELAQNGQEALDALADGAFAAVLMDCQMPVLDGYEATREIRRREKDGRRTPIIAMTASSMEGDRERCIAAGMDDYLSKPLRAEALQVALSRWAPREAVAAVEGPVLDEAVLADLEKLDPRTLSELTAMFLEDASAQIETLRRDVESGDAPAVASVAHKLTGSSGSLGAVGVSGVARELERRAEAGDLQGSEEHIRRLEVALEEFRNAFVHHLSENGRLSSDRSG